MRPTRTALIFVVSMLVFSILVANFANILSNVDQPHKSIPQKKYLPPMTDSTEHLIWFLQISDIHISIFRDPTRITEFKEFCDQTLDIIKPSVVLASGDLTDAKTRDNIGSKQFRMEWQYYRDVLNEAQVQKKTVWLDIRGNHDNFNVISAQSKENYFYNYSVQGGTHPRSYLHQIRKGGSLTSFIAVDACLEPGPKRPFNFVGMLDQPELDEINRIIEQVEASGSDNTVWFGHFPTSCILTSDASGVRALLRKLDQSLVYVCGHLHTLGGLVNRMYTLQKDGFLELELGDWKDNRRYRLLAIDHGLVSFEDQQHRDWPVVLITNPKHALFMIPGKENPEVIANSTHIRILAFSIANIKTVKVNLDDDGWLPCRHVSGPLYVADWNPSDYKTGVHYIQVFVKDEEGRHKIVSQPFSIDGTRLSFDLLPKIALMTNASTVFKIMFVTLVLTSILPLIIFRVVHKLVKVNKISKPNIPRGCLTIWVRKLWVLSTVDRIFYPLVLYPVYLSIGPWSIGHIIEDHIGVIFAWGIFVNGTYLPGSFTYFYGFLQLFTFQLPITFMLAHEVYQRFQFHVIKPGKTKTKLGRVFSYIPFIVLLIIQIIMAYFFWLAYGTMAFVLGPLRTWSVFLAMFMWYHAVNFPEKCAREAASVWCAKSESLSQTDISLNSTT